MSTGATQSARPLAIATPFGDDVLLLNSIVGSETLSTPFQYDLELQSEYDDLDPVSIVGYNVTIRVESSDSKTRYINGIVSEFTHAGWAERFTTYRARIVPWIWLLDQTADCRIFQKKNVPDIVKQIFTDLGFNDFKLKLTGSYPQLEYCVQYRETDLNFVSRLMEEEGIFYYFKHENGKHTLVVADATSAYFDLPDSKVEFPDPNHESAVANRVTEWEHSYSFRPGKYTHTDYNFKKPSLSLAKSENTRLKYRNIKAFEVYDYHGRHEDTGRGQQLAKVRLQELEARHDVATGRSFCGSFTPGGKFSFSYHRSQSEVGKSYVLTNVALRARLENYTTVEGGGFLFENHFQCIPSATLFRPERQSRKPVVEGPQTAVIVGPSGEEIYVDEFSRVKVQFHWDREGKRDENSSCWMRVSQAHAGAGWGYVDIPRIGEEVIVDFIEGDPDRPIITGRVYNAEVMPPYSLAGGDNTKNKTRRGNTTKTYKGGGYNEMTMDDTPGKEQIRVHGQYNMDTVVENDETHTVNNNRTRKVVNIEKVSVGVDRTEDVGNNEVLNVVNNRTETIGNNETLTVGNNRVRNVGANETINVGSSRTESVSMMQSESIGIMYNENVGVAKTSNIGVANSIAVGAVMNTAVGAISMEQVGVNKSVTVGSKLSINSGSIIEIICGASKLVMKKDGSISLEGKDILIKGSGKITAKAAGDMVLKGAKIAKN